MEVKTLFRLKAYKAADWAGATAEEAGEPGRHAVLAWSDQPAFLGSLQSTRGARVPGVVRLARKLHKLARPKHRLRQAGAHVLKTGICRTTLQ